jgi:hypothetical protein
MKLSVQIVGTRVKGQPYYAARTETEDYDVVNVVDASMDARTLANTLRAIADGIDPPFPHMPTATAFTHDSAGG